MGICQSAQPIDVEKLAVNPLKEAKDFPMGHDLTKDSEHAAYMKLASQMYGSLSLEELRAVDDHISKNMADTMQYSVLLHIAVKDAVSKKILDTLPVMHVTVVFALYHENNRMVKCGADVPGESHPNGENFVRRKHQQMSWLFENRKDCSWTLLGADDGCDRDSAGLMERIGKEEGYTNISVVRLNDACKAEQCEVLDFKKLKEGWNPNDNFVKASQKGGAIIYGLFEAAKQKSMAAGKRHIIVYTDSDLSTDLALCGLNFKTIFDGADVSVSQRFGQDNAVNCSNKLQSGGVGPGLARDSIVHLSLRHKLRMNLLPPLAPIIDTNCGHKVIDAEASYPVLKQVRDYKASFDMDWLMCVGNSGKARGSRKPIDVTAIPWVASVAESNFWGGGSDGKETEEEKKLKSMNSWFGIFAKLCEMNDWHEEGLKKTGQLSPECAAYKEWVKTLDVMAYMKLSDNILAKLGDKELEMPEPIIMSLSLAELKRLAA